MLHNLSVSTFSVRVAEISWVPSLIRASAFRLFGDHWRGTMPRGNVGCHAQGGGAIGPALMNAEWIYGSSLEQIHSTIVQGRPNGMPSFAGKIQDYQVWEIAAYVRSMSGLLPSDIAPSRSDHMPATLPESAKEKEHPEQENQQRVEGPKP